MYVNNKWNKDKSGSFLSTSSNKCGNYVHMVCLEFVKSRKIKLCTNYDIILQQMQYQIRYKLLDCPLVLVSCYIPKVSVKSIHTPIYLGMSAYNQKLSCSVLHWSIVQWSMEFHLTCKVHRALITSDVCSGTQLTRVQLTC